MQWSTEEVGRPKGQNGGRKDKMFVGEQLCVVWKGTIPIPIPIPISIALL